MSLTPRKYTADTFAKEHSLTRQSAINKLSQLKKKGLVTVSGGGAQKRIYTVRRIPKEPTSGFYDVVNKYSPEKLHPAFRHVTRGKYTVERAIIDGIQIGDTRTLKATQYLFRNIKDWKRLFDLARKHDLTQEVKQLYDQAKSNTLVKKMPKRYMDD